MKNTFVGVASLLMAGGLIATISLVPTDGADAHSALVSASPAANSIVTTAITNVTLVFNEEPNSSFPASTAIQVTEPGGKRIDTTKIEFDPTQKSVSVAVSPATNGIDQVVWQVLSVDGHSISGTYSFTYAAIPTPSASSTTQLIPPATTVPEPAHADGQSNESNLPLVVGLVTSMIVIMLAGAVTLLITWRRRRPRNALSQVPPSIDPSANDNPKESSGGE